MGLPLLMWQVVKVLCRQVEVRFVLNGRMSDERVAVRSGIKQGCRCSGTPWALLYDPVVRALSETMPLRESSVCCFADGLAAAAFLVRPALPFLLQRFDTVRKAAQLRVNVRNTALVNFGARGHEELFDEVAADIVGERMCVCVSSRGVYLTSVADGGMGAIA